MPRHKERTFEAYRLPYKISREARTIDSTTRLGYRCREWRYLEDYIDDNKPVQKQSIQRD